MILMSNAMMGAAGHQAAGGGGDLVALVNPSSFISIGDTGLVDGYSALSFSAHIRIDSNISQRLFAKWGDTGDQSCILTYDQPNSRILWAMRGTSDLMVKSFRVVSFTPTLGAELHMAMTWAAPYDFNLYLDGVLQVDTDFGDAGSPSSIYNSAASLALAGRVDGETSTLKGTLSDARIYNAVLSASDISTLRDNRFTNSVSTNLQGWWMLNGDLDDYSGNGHHGTAVGTITYEAAP